MAEHEVDTESRRLGMIASYLAEKNAILAKAKRTDKDGDCINRIDQELRALRVIERPR